MGLEMIEEMNQEPFYLDIDGRRYQLDADFLKKHPGGSVILTYKNRDATNVFNAFHYGSVPAAKWIKALKSEQIPPNPNPIKLAIEDERKNAEILANFDRFREKITNAGLLDVKSGYFAWKLSNCLAMIGLSFVLQYFGFYTASALILGLAWQQTGWISHDYSHHQPSKFFSIRDMQASVQDRAHNAKVGYLVGNVMQGFSENWWKEKHNVHHAATNIVGKDQDIDFAPIFVTKPTDIPQTTGYPWSTIIPYQHIYFWFAIPFLRVSWFTQSIFYVLGMRTSPYQTYRNVFQVELYTLLVHWAWVVTQLYMLPDFATMLQFFLISQLLGGGLISYVVTFNHNSMAKFSIDSPFHDNFPALQLYTTRNMRPSAFTDWLWGGLNYQIEHHLFPTMPRHNFAKAAPLVQQFAADNDLPYEVDDYLTGCKHNLKMLAQMAALALKFHKKVVRKHNKGGKVRRSSEKSSG